MADCLLLETGDRLVNEDGTGGCIVLEEVVVAPPVVGGARGRKSTQKGVSVFDQDQSLRKRRNLGERPKRRFLGKTVGKLILKEKNLSKGKLLYQVKFWVECIINPLDISGYNVGKLYYQEKHSAKAKLKLKTRVENFGILFSFDSESLKSLLGKFSKVKSLLKYSLMLQQIEALDNASQQQPRPEEIIHEFTFEDTWENWKGLLEPTHRIEKIEQGKLKKLWNELSEPKRRKLLKRTILDPNLAESNFDKLPEDAKKTLEDINQDDLIQILVLIAGVSLGGLYLNILTAPINEPISQIKERSREPIKPDKSIRRQPSFTQPSSFVGTVTYSPFFQKMGIELPGKLYSFCRVPERIFDSFQGAASKGAFFNRNIKGQFNC